MNNFTTVIIPGGVRERRIDYTSPFLKWMSFHLHFKMT
jgi:hypothetical protein